MHEGTQKYVHQKIYENLYNLAQLNELSHGNDAFLKKNEVSLLTIYAWINVFL